MTYTLPGKTNEWEIVVGLEVHCQIISNSKVFSGASASFGGMPNSHVSFIDAGFPGMLPSVNKYCLEQSIKTGMGLNAKINLNSRFDRKNYFYGDLPAGYQITQLFHPIVGEGYIDVDLEDGTTKRLRVERLHLEQDAGKSIHDRSPLFSYIDLNRAGVGLMEIVSMPDIRSPEEAGAYLRKLRAIVRALGTCDGNMDEGSMRCDANISVRPVGQTELRNRVEVKNLNSVKFVMQAIELEAKRQIALYDEGQPVPQETRLFDSAKMETRTMRSKENALDYRYFPDPDLPEVRLTQEYVDEIRRNLPELPDAKKKRFVEEYKITPYDAAILVSETDIASFFENTVKGRENQAQKAANWIVGDLFGVLNKSALSISDSPVSPEHLGELIDLLSEEVISSKIAKEVFEIMVETGDSPKKIVEEKGLKQITDTSAIEGILDKIIADNPANVAEYKAGKEKLIGWFVGQAMKATQGKANPGLLNEMLKKKLSA